MAELWQDYGRKVVGLWQDYGKIDLNQDKIWLDSDHKSTFEFFCISLSHIC
jgi:hypothetical protein